jgi:hypothetical protein
MPDQKDLSESTIILFTIAINLNTFSDDEDIKNQLADTLESMKNEKQISQYSILSDATSLSSHRIHEDRDELHQMLPPFFDFGRGAFQITTQIAKGITENKNILDILTDLVTIFGVTLPIVRKIYAILQKKKEDERDKKVPYVRITVGRYSIEVESSDLKESEESALRLAERFLEKHPNAKPSNKVKINSGLGISFESKKPQNAPRQSGSKKRSKKRPS